LGDIRLSIADYQVVHELPGRLRLPVPALGRLGFEPSALESWLDRLLRRLLPSRASFGLGRARR